MKKLLLILTLILANAVFCAETWADAVNVPAISVLSADVGESVNSTETQGVVSSVDTQETYAVVIVPFAPLIADDGTRDDEVLYGMTMKAALSGDYVFLDMPYGTLPIEAKNVELVSKSQAETWNNSVTHNIIAPFADIQSEAKTQSFPPIITLPRGAKIKIGEINSDDERYIQAELFGGVKGWVRRPLIRPLRQWNAEDEEAARKKVVDDAKLYLGTSYRWGGQTPVGVDCSGLVHMAYILNGLEVFRNSWPKFGFPIALKHLEGNPDNTHDLETLKSLKPGDTIHFSGHVGMYLGGGKFIHANGSDFSTTIASLISSDKDYREDIARPSEINTFGTVFPDEPEKLSIKDFYARSFTSGDKVGYRFYVRAEGYTPSKAILYPEGLSSDAIIEISNDVKLWRFVYSGRDTERAPEYFYTKPGKYTPAVELINETGYRPSGKIITSGIYEMNEALNVITSPEIYEVKALEAKISMDNSPSTKLSSDEIPAETKAIDKKTSPDIPSGFVKLSEFAPEILQEIRYYSDYNFVGKRIDGYEAPEAILTIEAAQALKAVNDELMKNGYKLKIYDAYRPQRAVNHFVRWANNLKDTKMKKDFYPELKKSVLFKQGYIARKSGHSRGSTVDLTIFDTKASKDLDMGGTFDYFGKRSHFDFKKITKEQYANRRLLRETMTKHGFRPISTEWWHFTLNNEPYPKTYFDFAIKGNE